MRKTDKFKKACNILNIDWKTTKLSHEEIYLRMDEKDKCWSIKQKTWNDKNYINQNNELNIREKLFNIKIWNWVITIHSI